MIHTTKDIPKIVRDFLVYMETIRGKSKKTADEYYLDLRVFFRYIKLSRGLVPDEMEFDQIPIDDVDIDMISSVTLSDIYDYMTGQKYLNFIADVFKVGKAERNERIKKYADMFELTRLRSGRFSNT